MHAHHHHHQLFNFRYSSPVLYYNIALPALVCLPVPPPLPPCAELAALCFADRLRSTLSKRTCYAHTYSRTTHNNQPYKHHRHHARKHLFTASAARPKSLYAPILRFTPAQPRGVVKSQFAVILDNIGLYFFSCLT